jgi:hypothetical protein
MFPSAKLTKPARYLNIDLLTSVRPSESSLISDFESDDLGGIFFANATMAAQQTTLNEKS